MHSTFEVVKVNKRPTFAFSPVLFPEQYFYLFNLFIDDFAAGTIYMCIHNCKGIYMVPGMLIRSTSTQNDTKGKWG